jgi:hypothetical protein
MAKKAVKKPKSQLRSIACKHLQQLNEISNAGNPLCYCQLRKFNVSPYNHVCQICKKYSENVSGITHAEMFIAEAAANFVFDMDQIISASDLVEEIEEPDSFVVSKKKKKKKSKAKIVEEEDEEEEEPVVADEDDDVLVIGHEKEEKEESVDYEDEREEGTGKRHGHTGSEDDEDEDLEEDLDDMEDNTSARAGANDIDISDIDFEADVIAKIKTIGIGEDKKEICPYCQKSKVNVLRHLSKCKRCPPEIIKAHSVWKKQKPKKGTKKKATKKSTKKKATKAKK